MKLWVTDTSKLSCTGNKKTQICKRKTLLVDSRNNFSENIVELDGQPAKGEQYNDDD